MTKPKARGAYGRLTKPAPDPEPEAGTGSLADRVRADAAKRTPPRQRETPLYGRAKQGLPQLNVRIEADTKRRLERYCFEHGVLMADVVDRVIREHLDREGA